MSYSSVVFLKIDVLFYKPSFPHHVTLELLIIRCTPVKDCVGQKPKPSFGPKNCKRSTGTSKSFLKELPPRSRAQLYTTLASKTRQRRLISLYKKKNMLVFRKFIHHFLAGLGTKYSWLIPVYSQNLGYEQRRSVLRKTFQACFCLVP